MQRLLGLIACLVAAALASPQSAVATPIQQSGSVTPGHATMWTTDGVVQDGGAATAGNLTELGVTKNGGRAICVNSGPITASYQEVCLGANITSGVGSPAGAVIDLEAFGGASNEPLKFIVDGQVVLTLSSTTTGLVTVSGTPTSGHCAEWLTSTSIEDSGGACGGSSSSIAPGTILGNNSNTTQPAFALTTEQVGTMLSLLDNAVSEGADPTGTADSTTAIQTAFNTCAAYIPPGTYKITSQLTSGSCTNITYVGAGSSKTKITINSTSATAFVNSATNGTFQGMTWDRSGTPVSNGLGLNFSAATNQMILYDLVVQDQWQGIWLGNAAYSTARNVVSQSNYSDGFLITDSFVNGAVQWTLDTVISQMNNGKCINVTALGSVLMQLIPWENVTCFGNTGGGIWSTATSISNRIEGFQLNVGQLNSDGNDELRLTTYALSPIVVTQSLIALAGQTNTGRSLATSPSGTGNGINITGNNGKVVFAEDVIEQNSKDGIACASGAITDALELDNVVSELNGASTPGATWHGLSEACTPTATIISGGSYGNRTGSTNQAYGIGLASGVGVTLQGVNVPSNNILGFNITASASSAFCSGIQGESMTLIGCNQGSGGSGVTSVSSTWGPLTISPTTGAVVASATPTSDGTLMSNISGGSGAPANNNLSSVFDHDVGSSIGDVFVRNGIGWGVVQLTNNTVLGNLGSNNVALSQAQLTGLCNLFNSSTSGCVSASGGGTTKFLRADNTFAVPPGSTSFANSTLASATTTDLGSAATNFITITGTTTITSFGTSASTSNPLFFVQINTGSPGNGPLLTYNGTSLGIVGGQNVQTRTGDSFVAVYLGSGNWEVISYSQITGQTASVFGQQTNIASASTTDIATVGGNDVQITGTVTITSLGSSASTANSVFVVRFNNTLTLTNSGSLQLPGGSNITTASGDYMIAQYQGSGNWQVLGYFPKGAAPAGLSVPSGTSGGIPYYSSVSTIASSALLTANLPVFGGGAGTAPFVGTRSGNTTEVATVTGATTSGDLASFDASGNVIDKRLDSYQFTWGGPMSTTATPGVLNNNQIIGYQMFPVGVTCPANFSTPNSVGSAAANATSSTVITIQKRTASPNTWGTTIGTITYGAGTVTVTYATTGGTSVSVSAGDVWRFIGPGSADATLADPFGTIYCTR